MATTRKGIRDGRVRYFCKSCRRKFSVNYQERLRGNSAKELLKDYLDGLPLRKIADQVKLSPPTIYRRCLSGLKFLPRNLEVTRKSVDLSSYSGYLVFDGKYLAVKGYPEKIVLLWGADFLSHDLPHYLLAPSENYQACLSYFSSLKELGYSLRLLICDDNDAIKMAVRYIYPNVSVQTCQNHFLENVRKDLSIRSDPTHQPFYLSLEGVLKEKLDPFEFNLRLAEIFKKFEGQTNERISNWIGTFLKYKEELLAYQKFPESPWTTNLIEAYNSHLEGRLKTIKGFQSYHSANLWLNGYLLRRRLKAFTDCEEPFKHLNGKSPLQNVLRTGEKLPLIFD